MSDNPLSQLSGLPPFDQIEASHVAPAMKERLHSAEESIERLEAYEMSDNPERAWDEVMGELERIVDELYQPWGVVGHLLGVRNSEPLRAAHEQMQPSVVELSVRMAQSPQLYERFKRLRELGADQGLTRRRILDSQLKEAELSGVALQGEQRERFGAISARLAELSTSFSNNLLDATKAWTLLMTEPQEVEGLPPSALAMAAQSARAHGHESATAEAGPWVVTLDYPSFGPFLRHARRRDLRERVYLAYVTRASSGDLDNGPLIDEILTLRREKAALLGFNSYAELSLETKMASTVAQIRTLLEELLQASTARAKDEMRDVEALAERSGESLPLRQWDVAFWAERLREQRYDIDEESLRPWFPFPKVLDGLLKLTTELFGVTFEDKTTQVQRWHPDVRYFAVLGDHGQPLAGFYLDPYARPGEKRGGAWMDECLSRSVRLGDRVGPRLPVAYLVCNGTPPVDDRPSMMTFREVETLFHEFGHGLQHMLTEVDEGLASGIRNIEWDAVELPSQFMENWCYQHETMQAISGHVDTGAPLPDELFKKLRAAKTFRAASMMLRQIDFALTDLALHHEYVGEESVHDLRQRVAKRTALMPPLAEDRFLCAFSHIFAGGYAAGYYSYKWAEVLSADAFGAFEDSGLEDANARATLGAKFRATVLAQGGSAAPMDVFVAFRGREPTTEALLRHSGLS